MGGAESNSTLSRGFACLERHLTHYIFLKEEQELTDFLEKWLLATVSKKKSHLVVNTFKMSSGDICKLETDYFQVAYFQKQSA